MIGANVKTVCEALVASITSINLSEPLSNSQAEFVRQLWNEFPILYFPKQSLEPTNLRSFGEVFGRPEPEPPMNEIYLQEGEDAISYVGNIHPDGRVVFCRQLAPSNGHEQNAGHSRATARARGIGF